MVLSGYAEAAGSRTAQKAQERGVRKIPVGRMKRIDRSAAMQSREKSEPVKELAKILK